MVVLACMLAASGSAMLMRPTVRLADQGPKVDLQVLFPAQFDGWKVDRDLPVVLPSPEVQAKLDRIYNQVLSRTYVSTEGERVMLSVAYGGDQSDGTRAHRPEVCYPAQGFEVLSSQLGRWNVVDRSLPVRQLVTRLGTRTEPVSYWIIVGDRVASSGSSQKLAQLAYGLRGEVPDGMLVRVSTISSDSEKAFLVQRQFVDSMLRAVSEAGRVRIAGAPGVDVASAD
jgi:EpsI family protein